MEQSMTEKTVKKAVDYLIGTTEISKVNYLKCKLGMEVFFLNFTKLVIIYSTALFLGLPKEVAIFHSSFMLIRFFSYGAHAVSSLACTSISLLLFVGIPYVLQEGLLPSELLLLINLVNFILLAKYAPGKTKKNFLGDKEHQRLLKRRSLIGNLLVLLVFLTISDLRVCNLIVLGSFLAGLLVVPLTNNLFSIKFNSRKDMREWERY